MVSKAGAKNPGQRGMMTRSQSKAISDSTKDAFPLSSWSSLRLATWNIHGGFREATAHECVIKDLVKRKIDIAGLQETYLTNGTEVRTDDGRLLCLECPVDTPDSRKYGLGFFISKRVEPLYFDHKVVSNRISLLRLKFTGRGAEKHNRRRRSIITIVNVYAPTSEVAAKDEDLIVGFYKQLKDVVEDAEKHSVAVYILGDFNSKLGDRTLSQDGETWAKIMGSYGKGVRNANGNRLANFMLQHDYYAGNTKFRHSLIHRTTWHSNNLKYKQPNGELQQVRNQIDYVLVKECYKNAIISGRSHHGHEFDSDHGIVVVGISIEILFRLRCKYSNARRSVHGSNVDINNDMDNVWPRNCQPTSMRLNRKNLDSMTQNPQVIEEYKENILDGFSNNITGKSDYENFTNTIVNSSAVLKDKIINKNNTIVFKDDVLAKLSYDHKQLRIVTIGKKRFNPHEVARTKKIRNKLTNQIARRIRELHQQRITNLAKELEETSNVRRKFEVNRMFKQSSYKTFELKDADGYSSYSSSKLIGMVSEYYNKFFNPPNIEKVTDVWDGYSGGLKKPLTKEEVMVGMASIRNGRATGSDGIAGEFIKYGGEAMANQVAKIFNNIFISKVLVPELCEGILIPLNKPGKEKLVSNVRPITLLNSIRKLISVIILNRIYPDVEKYVPNSQCGFRRRRCSAEIAWTYGWLKAIAGRYKRVFHIIGIDMSAAFDSILRKELLYTLKIILNEDEYRMIRVLLTNTTLKVRVGREVGRPFGTTIGTPQGDGLSPILFVIYLETAMKSIRETDIALYGKCNGANWNTDIQELQYADDCDFICSVSNDSLESLLDHLPGKFSIFNLTVNKLKTERKNIRGGATRLSDYKKLGSHLDPIADVKLRIQKAQVAFHSMWKTWKCGNLKRSTRIRLYNICIVPILLYNIGAVPYTEVCYDKLEAAQRGHYRRILGIHYPKVISNANLYNSTNSTMLRCKIIRARWNIFRKAITQAVQCPANSVMMSYFRDIDTAPKVRGRSPTTIASVLQADLRLIGKPIITIDNIDTYRTLRKDEWKALITSIMDKTMEKVNTTVQKRDTRRKQRNEEIKRCKSLGIGRPKRRRRSVNVPTNALTNINNTSEVRPVQSSGISFNVTNNIDQVTEPNLRDTYLLANASTEIIKDSTKSKKRKTPSDNETNPEAERGIRKRLGESNHNGQEG